MKVRLAKSFGFCFGVKRAIKIAEKSRGGVTFGALIHNQKEIDRLRHSFGVKLVQTLDEVDGGDQVIVRTHGIPKNDLMALRQKNVSVTDATCPYVTKPQKIVEEMSAQGYQVIIFGDMTHPEVKSVMSYSSTPAIVVGSLDELIDTKIPKRVALVSQTTKQTEKFIEIAHFLIRNAHETRVFNTICNATFQNQDATRELAQEVDVMVVVGGLSSSNTKQLFSIAKEYCPDSYLIEDEKDLNKEWFLGKKICGLTAGASTPDWIIQNVKRAIEAL
ncbi:4-hydroxy-3-methylbut-2-enyl diphosphate reductase [Helicobacter pametensis]|uniref:4-hydroxy-3-methylbut-2-enyl diphosphate reductase n=1 Tax=Helicobacter pametensis TaxID=95149 RepID=UPI000480EC0F|nr:4-hydroxy-3-methylbut-2-enyl diphosphate reductase [Helicobacter pametensis]